MRIAMIGTRGVPARYGGFETAVEEIGARLADAGHDVVVYTRNTSGERPARFRGMRVVHLPSLRTKSLDTLSHSALSVVDAAVRRRPDVAFVFNAANAPFLGMLRAARIPTAVHVDGLEWKRAKWAGAGARFYRWAERRSVARAPVVIADARAIADSVFERFGRDSAFIPYGAPIVHPGSSRLAAVSVESRRYHLVVARLEPENNVHVIVEGYRRSKARYPLVVAGSVPYESAYRRDLEEAMRADDRIIALGGVWDQALLDELYGNALTVLHGHSVGGTNPSLLRAMGAGAACVVLDVPFNREVTAGNALIFADASDVAIAVQTAEADPAAMAELGERARAHAATCYNWDDVARRYENVARELSGRA